MKNLTPPLFFRLFLFWYIAVTVVTTVTGAGHPSPHQCIRFISVYAFLVHRCHGSDYGDCCRSSVSASVYTLYYLYASFPTTGVSVIRLRISVYALLSLLLFSYYWCVGHPSPHQCIRFTIFTPLFLLLVCRSSVSTSAYTYIHTYIRMYQSCV
jgi:hypothetical protein